MKGVAMKEKGSLKGPKEFQSSYYQQQVVATSWS
jgi:hypothetical protein